MLRAVTEPPVLSSASERYQAMDSLGLEPRAPRVLSGRDATTPRAQCTFFICFTTAPCAAAAWRYAAACCAVAAIAQLGERQTEDLKVPGSIPGLGT